MKRKHVLALSVGFVAVALAFVALGVAGEGKSCDKSDYTKQASSKKVSTCTKQTSTASGCTRQAKTALADSKKGCFWNSQAAAATCSEKCAEKASTAACCSKAKTGTFKEAKVQRHDSQRMVVTGSIACSKCLVGATEKCRPVLLTADGTFYHLHKNNRLKEMGQTKADNGFRVEARVRKLDGTKYLQVESYRVL